MMMMIMTKEKWLHFLTLHVYKYFFSHRFLIKIYYNFRFADLYEEAKKKSMVLAASQEIQNKFLCWNMLIPIRINFFLKK